MLTLCGKRLFLRAVRSTDLCTFATAFSPSANYILLYRVSTEKLRIISWNCISRSTAEWIYQYQYTSSVCPLCIARNTTTVSRYDWSSKHRSMISLNLLPCSLLLDRASMKPPASPSMRFSTYSLGAPLTAEDALVCWGLPYQTFHALTFSYPSFLKTISVK